VETFLTLLNHRKQVDVKSPFKVEEWGEKGQLMHTERTPGMHVISETDGSPLVKGGSDAEIDKICKAGKGGKGGCAYATLITDDSYLTGYPSETKLHLPSFFVTCFPVFTSFCVAVELNLWSPLNLGILTRRRSPHAPIQRAKNGL